MAKLKWFSEGKTRKEQAVVIIEALLGELTEDRNSQPLQNILFQYKEELENPKISIPFILSRMNVDISRIVTENGILLSNHQSSH